MTSRPPASGSADESTAELDAEELRLLVQRLSRRIRVRRATDGVSDAQLGVLFQLERADADGLSPGRLAELERVTPPSINRTINALEVDGWVTRHPDADDARRVRVRITPAGTAIIAETRRLRAQWFTERLAGLSAVERRALGRAIPVLRRLVDE